jgi:uncharacterized protein YbcV (DUF1398 family)
MIGRPGGQRLEPQLRKERHMDSHAKEVVREMSRASDEESIAFPDVVKALMGVGLERYHADLICSNKTYYMPDGDFEIVACNAVGAPAQEFNAGGVEAAVRAIEARSIQYREFCERIAAAGCVGYFVTIVGRRAVYYGRDGDSHVERFPAAK